LALLRLKLDLINPIYLSHYFCTNFAKLQVQKYNKGGAKAGLNFTDIKKINVLIPSKPLQDKFAEIVTQIEQIKTIYEDSLNELNNLFGSIAQKAFKGELDVNKIELIQKEQEEITMVIKLDENRLVEEIKKGDFETSKYVNEHQNYDAIKDMIFKLIEDKKISQKFDNNSKKIILEAN
jgi:type I restriction enzyme S subunit